MDSCLAKIISPMLRHFRANKIGIPGELLPSTPMDQLTFDFIDHDEEHCEAEQRWNTIIDEMIWAFEVIASDSMTYEANEETNRRVDAALSNFAKYYGNLWV
mgnify:CR=1 FL=1